MAKPTVAMLQAQLAERDQMISDRDARIAELQTQIKTLEAKTRKPGPREQPDSIKALPDLRPDQSGIRLTCPLNAEHGEVTPNVHHKCPKCYTFCMWANSEAGKQALAHSAGSLTS